MKFGIRTPSLKKRCIIRYITAPVSIYSNCSKGYSSKWNYWQHSRRNFTIETLAIKTVFGEKAKNVPVSSVKSMLGHLIGAAGAAELITCILAIRDGIIPHTANYQDPEPELDLDYVPNKPRKADIRIAMSESFGFGGQNDVVIVRKYK